MTSGRASKKAKRLFSEVRPLFDNIDPRLMKISTDELLYSGLAARQFNTRPSKKSLEEAQEFFTQAKKDLRASRLLYKNGDFGNSVSLFQQCIEKACKAYGLRFGLIKNAKAISHQSPMVFIEMLRNVFRETDLLRILEKFSGENEKQKIINAETLIKSNNQDIILMSEQQLDTYIKLMNQFPKLFMKATKEKFLSVQELIKRFIPSFEQICYMALIPLNLFVLSVISYQHWQRPRYPGTPLLSSRDYDTSLPLVMKLPELHKIGQRTLKDMDLYFEPTN